MANMLTEHLAVCVRLLGAYWHTLCILAVGHVYCTYEWSMLVRDRAYIYSICCLWKNQLSGLEFSTGC